MSSCQEAPLIRLEEITSWSPELKQKRWNENATIVDQSDDVPKNRVTTVVAYPLPAFRRLTDRKGAVPLGHRPSTVDNRGQIDKLSGKPN